MTPEPKKPVEQIQKEFNDATEKQRPRPKPEDTTEYGKKATGPDKPYADED